MNVAATTMLNWLGFLEASWCNRQIENPYSSLQLGPSRSAVLTTHSLPRTPLDESIRIRAH
jgi:hypothetical protein